MTEAARPEVTVATEGGLMELSGDRCASASVDAGAMTTMSTALTQGTLPVSLEGLCDRRVSSVRP